MASNIRLPHDVRDDDPAVTQPALDQRHQANTPKPVEIRDGVLVVNLQTFIGNLPNLLLVIQLVMSFFAFLSIIVGPRGTTYGFFATVAAFSFMYSTVLLIFKGCQFYSKYSNLPWRLMEAISMAIVLCFWILADILLLAYLKYANSGAALVFGMFTVLAYTGSFYISFMTLRKMRRNTSQDNPDQSQNSDDGEQSDRPPEYSQHESRHPLPTHPRLTLADEIKNASDSDDVF